ELQVIHRACALGPLVVAASRPGRVPINPVPAVRTAQKAVLGYMVEEGIDDAPGLWQKRFQKCRIAAPCCKVMEQPHPIKAELRNRLRRPAWIARLDEAIGQS